MGKHRVGKMNENGEIYAETHVNNNLVIGRSVFPIKQSTKQLVCHQNMLQKTKLTTFVSVKSSEGPLKMSDQEKEQMQLQITIFWWENSS